MELQLGASWLIALLLVSVRLGIFIVNSPLDVLGHLPAKIKLFVLLAFSFLMVGILYPQGVSVPATLIELFQMMAAELLNGLIMGLGLAITFAVFEMGGRLLDFQSGFSAASLFNPATNNQDSLLGTVFILAATFWFYSAGLHHYLLKVFAHSLEIIPLGTTFEKLDASIVLRQLGIMTTYGILLVAPILAVLFLTDTAIAFMSRSMPQMNVYFLFLPLKIGLTLVVTAISIRYFSGFTQNYVHMLDSYFKLLLS